MLMLTSRRALKQQNLDHNTLSRMLGTLGAGVSSDLRTAEIHSPALWPHVVTRRVGSESATHTHTQSGHSKLLKNRSSVCVWEWLVFHMIAGYSPWLLTNLPWELRWLMEDTFCRGMSLFGSSVIVHQVRLHTWEKSKKQNQESFIYSLSSR